MTRQSLKWTIFFVTTLGNFSSMLDFSSVNIALYNISKSFNLPVSTVQWVMLSYQIILTSMLIFFGRLSDMINRKKLYVLGFVIFAIGAFCSYFSPNFILLLIARTVQGIGGSILISNSFSIVSIVFKGSQRGKALGFMGAVTHLAGMTAPVISGYLIEQFQWRSIFLPSGIVATIAIFLSMRFIPASYPHKKVEIDGIGTILLGLSISSLLFVLAKSATLVPISIMFVSFALFIRHENKINVPLVDFSLFRNKTFLFGNLALMTSYWAMYPNTILFPFYSQEVLQNSAKLTGQLILPFSLFYLITAINTGTLSPYKRMFFGMSMMGISLILFAQTTLTTTSIILILLQILIGVSNALFQPSVNAAILNSAPKSHVGMASGILSLFRNTGIAIGSVLSISLFEFYKNRLVEQGTDIRIAFLNSYHVSLYVGFVFVLVCLIFIFNACRSKRGSEC